MRLREYLIERAVPGGVQKYFKELEKMSTSKVEKVLKSGWMELRDVLIERGLEEKAISIINKRFHTNFKSFTHIDKMSIGKPKMVNEDFKHYWDFIKSEAFPALSFFPALQAWLEINQLLSGEGFSSVKFGVYGIFWVLLVSGKFVTLWNKWKKENPEEWEKEGARRNPLAIK